MGHFGHVLYDRCAALVIRRHIPAAGDGTAPSGASLLSADVEQRATGNGFLSSGTTYLPHGFSSAAVGDFGEGAPAKLLEETGSLAEDSYERVGVDRALAVAADLALLGIRRGATILDVGCSVGTISLLLASIGYHVTGVDSDVVADVQSWHDRGKLQGIRKAVISDRCHLMRADIRRYLASTEERFDVTLLFSVVHHWIEGYGYSGEQQFTRAEVDTTLRGLCARTRSHIYLETPISDEEASMRPDPEGEFVFPAWFLNSHLADRVELIASTVATNAQPRRLYRLDLV
ncbi:MAG: class I SAM-dependent methyltransferase [Acidimicrobiia bacterium]